MLVNYAQLADALLFNLGNYSWWQADSLEQLTLKGLFSRHPEPHGWKQRAFQEREYCCQALSIISVAQVCQDWMAAFPQHVRFIKASYLQQQ